MLRNDRLIRALRRQPVDTTPVWIMRQAGRYLPEYRATRKQAGSFLALCHDPQRACEVTLQPLERFELDAAIIFSDILTVPDAMGAGLYFEDGEGPRFRSPVRGAVQVAALRDPDVDADLGYVGEAIRVTQKALDGRVPLLGFAGSPWTVATYMIEGGSSKDFRVCKRLMMESPDVMHELLSRLADVTARYLLMQIRAGADAVQIFDTWGGVLSTPAYREFSLAYMQRIVHALAAEPCARDVPVILFTKQGGQWLEHMADTGAHCLGLDWTVEIDRARQRVGDRVCLQGNLDPAVLYASPERIRNEVRDLLDAFGNHPGHVFNLGHGISRDVDPDHLRVLVDAVHEFGTRS